MALTTHEIALELVKIATPQPNPTNKDQIIEMYLFFLKKLEDFERTSL